jgi:GNAT superfamily N-acetyltransferase
MDGKRMARLNGPGVRRDDPPAVPGFSTRGFSGASDIPKIVHITNESWAADLSDIVITSDELIESYAHPQNFDPRKDLLLAEVDRELIGVGSVTWSDRRGDIRVYKHQAHLLPQWRGMGIRHYMLRKNEARLREIAKSEVADKKSIFEVWTNMETNHWKSVLESSGYEPAWYVFEMIRSLDEDITALPLPEGIEVRPVDSENYRAVWDAAKEALRDEREYSDERWSDTSYGLFIRSRKFTPELFQIAWAGDEVVGGVHNFIDEEENAQLNRAWGHTEEIFVRQPWRRRGIARALIAGSLNVLKDRGIEYATLDVDADNPSGALRLYESVGYKCDKRFVFYRKPL